MSDIIVRGLQAVASLKEQTKKYLTSIGKAKGWNKDSDAATVAREPLTTDTLAERLKYRHIEVDNDNLLDTLICDSGKFEGETLRGILTRLEKAAPGSIGELGKRITNAKGLLNYLLRDQADLHRESVGVNVSQAELDATIEAGLFEKPARKEATKKAAATGETLDV